MRSTWTIPQNRWHARIWAYWHEIAFFKNKRRYTENLCHYWRVVLFWGPVMAFFNWFLAGGKPSDPRNREDKVPPVFFLAFGLILGTWGAIAFSVGSIALGATIFVGGPLGLAATIAGAVFVAGKIDDYQRDRMYGDAPKEPNMAWEYIKAKKHRVCPIIEVEGYGYD